MKNIFKLVLPLLLVTACQQAEEKLLRLSGKKPPKNAIHEPIYCYKTLGEVNCYNQPQKGWEGRMVGHFEPPPPPPPPPAPPAKKEAGEPAVNSTEIIYEIKVEDLAKPEAKPKEPPIPPIRPLIQR